MNLLEAKAPTAGIGQISYGASITTNYNSPLVDSRTPDIIVAPNVGVVYTGSATKQAEHGGLANEDINIYDAAGIQPGRQAEHNLSIRGNETGGSDDYPLLGLDAVKLEGTTVLVCLFSTGAISPLCQ